MQSRRQLTISATAAISMPFAPQACAATSGGLNYEEAVKRKWRSSSGDESKGAPLMRELVRYASLAPSSHNTPCWKFGMGQHSISVVSDLSRRCPAVDLDDHHLFVSLGCATENLVQAALANGLMGEATFKMVPADVIQVDLHPARAIASPLHEAMIWRQCTRAEFDGRAISSEELGLLQRAGSGQGIKLVLLTEKPSMEKSP